MQLIGYVHKLLCFQTLNCMCNLKWMQAQLLKPRVHFVMINEA